MSSNDPAAPDTFLDRDPATGEVLAAIPASSPADVHAAVALAQAAWLSWFERPFEERAGALRRAGEALGKRADEVATLVTREMGKPFAEARREVRGRARWIGDVLLEIEAALAVEEIEGRGGRTRIERHPLGVVAAITPWNFPVGMPLDLLVPGLAAGNAVVFKPSEHVPLTGAALHEIFAAELPEGLLQLVQGGGDVGAALVAADVDMIGFVGSRATGKHIMQSASGGLKRLVLELGGKDPLIVFADADLEAAAECAVQHSLRNTGQVCCSVERIYVEHSVAERFEALVLDKARAWTHGNGFDDGVHMGPMVSKQQRDKVAAQVRHAVDAGARLLLGGTLPEGPGAFYPATVLADVSEAMALSSEETFGPVVSLSTFEGGEEEAVRLANDTEYGLGANVFTNDLDKGTRVARRIRSGQVGVNRYLAAAPNAPWVGARQSGFGFLGGPDGHRQFTVPKSISVQDRSAAR